VLTVPESLQSQSLEGLLGVVMRLDPGEERFEVYSLAVARALYALAKLGAEGKLLTVQNGVEISEIPKSLLAASQDLLLFNMQAPKFAMWLMTMEHSPLHMEGLRLANWLLKDTLDSKGQQCFMEILEGKFDNLYLCSERIVKSLVNPINNAIAHLKKSHMSLNANILQQLDLLFIFLAHLCDGQFGKAQSFLKDKTKIITPTQAPLDQNIPPEPQGILELTVKLFNQLHATFKEIDGIDSTSNLLNSVLKLAQQIATSMAEWITGSDDCNQVLIDGGIIQTLGNWMQLIHSQTNSLLHQMAQHTGDKSLPQHRINLLSSLANLELEISMLLLLVLEGSVTAALIEKILEHFDEKVFIKQFHLNWKIAVIGTKDEKKVFQEGGEKMSYKSLSKEDDESTYALDKSSEAYTMTEVSGANNELDSSEATSKWSWTPFIKAFFKKEEHQVRSLTTALHYNIVLETVSDFSQRSNEPSDQRFNETSRQRLKAWREGWTRRSDPESIISEHEVEPLPNYFGVIEVDLKRESGKLDRIFFIIPEEVRSQMGNLLVENEKRNILMNVDRDSKLDDFLDKSIQLSNTIKNQHELNTKSGSSIRKFILKNMFIWVTLEYFVTLTINIIMIKYAECNPEEDESSASSGTSSETSSEEFVCSNLSQYDYMPEHIYSVVRILGFCHIALALFLVINFCVGHVPAIIQKGRDWKGMVESGKIILKTDESVQTFEMANKYLPEHLWTVGFLLWNLRVWYYALFLLFSLMGIIRSPIWFAFHVLDIATRFRILTDVLQSVTENGFQVLATLGLGIVIVYCFAVVAFGNYGWNVYEFGDGGGGIMSLWEACLQHIDFGLRGPPAFTVDDVSADMYVFGFVYNMLIILIMVAIITGIIIDTFAEKRAEKNQIEDEIKNVCFICNQKREVFERKRIAFNEHTTKQHNVWNYVYYRMYLEKKPVATLTAIEKELKGKMEKQDISYFPEGKAIVLQNMGDEEEEDQAKIQDMIDKVNDDMKSLSESVENKIEDMKKLSESVQHKVEGIENKINWLATLIQSKKN